MCSEQRGPCETQALFEDGPYDLPDEVAYAERRRKEGLFDLTEAEERAWKEHQEQMAVGSP